MTIYPPTDPRAYIDDCDCEDCRLQRTDKLAAAVQELLTRECELNMWRSAVKLAGPKINKRSMAFIEADTDYHYRAAMAVKDIVALTGWGEPPLVTIPPEALRASKPTPTE